MDNFINQPLKNLKADYIRRNIKAVTFDLDGVVIPSGTYLRENVLGTELLIKTHKLSPRLVKIIQELKKHLWINFSSGRSLLYMQNMLADVLWDKVSLTAENGNFMLLCGQVWQNFNYQADYFQKLNNIRQDLKKLKLKHPTDIFGFEPKQMILTLHTKKPMPAVARIVKKNDKTGELYCLWTSEGYDIGHQKTNKAKALEILARKLKIKPSQMITTGNNLNDKEMLKFGIGVSVNPQLVSGRYAIPPKAGQLGGETLASHLLKAFR